MAVTFFSLDDLPRNESVIYRGIHFNQALFILLIFFFFFFASSAGSPYLTFLQRIFVGKDKTNHHKEHLMMHGDD